jgi:hypothetical protein
LNRKDPDTNLDVIILNHLQRLEAIALNKSDETEKLSKDNKIFLN